MSGEIGLQRSSWKVEAIRRGDLKISGPIPITEETPLTEDEEKAYAEKQRAEAPPSSQDPPMQETHPPPPQHQPPPPPLAQPEPSTKHEVHQSTAQVEQPKIQEDQSSSPPKMLSNGARETSEIPRGSPVEPTAYSSPSPFPSIPESSTKAKRKRKSGLRNVFRKMFGRRSRDEVHEEEQPMVHQKGHGHHVSDPGLLRQSPERQKQTPSGPRISDLPVRELEPINPLAQHLPFPMNVNAPQETSPPHEYLTFEAPTPELGRRRATLPSVLLANNDVPRSAGWADANRRLATWDEQHDGDSIPSPQIGIALSSPPHNSAHSIQSKRRSRSAGALRDLAKARPSVERRRSAEIRYWRNSYASGSVYSSQTPRPQTARTVETVRTVDTRDTRETHDTAATVPESDPKLSTSQAPIIPQHDQDLSEIQLPVEAFNFGNLKSGFSDDEEEQAPEEPGVRSPKRLSIEDRVRHLEENMRDLESSVRRISGRSNRQTIVLENAPKGRRSRNRSSSATSERQGSHHSRSSGHTLQDTRDPPSPVLAPLSAVQEFPSSTDRPQTVIAIEPDRPTTAQGSDIAQQFAAVYEALKHERYARKALEKQVSDLQREVLDLHSLVNKLIISATASPSYPTPSPDAIITSSEDRVTTPRASNRPGLGIDTERSARTTVISRFSQSDSEDHSVTSSREDITSPEAWATPKEESGFGSGFFTTRSRSRSREALKAKDGEDEMF